MSPLSTSQLSKLNRLYLYSDRYDINIQFWPSQVSVYIEKEGVPLVDYGGSFDFAMDNSLNYLDRINGVKK